MDEIQKLLNNPVIKNGLRIASPEIALGVEILSAVGSGLFQGKKTPKATELLAVIDKRLAKVLNDLATTESRYYRRECETRAHELLGILNEWEKLN